MGSNPPHPCPKDTWRPHIRRRCPPCPKAGVRTHKLGALRHIRSPLDLQHEQRGSEIDKMSSTGLNTYTTMNIYVWRPSEGGTWPIKAGNLMMKTLTSSPTHHNARMDANGFSSGGCRKHQMDQHVLDIEGNTLVL